MLISPSQWGTALLAHQELVDGARVVRIIADQGAVLDRLVGCLARAEGPLQERSGMMNQGIPHFEQVDCCGGEQPRPAGCVRKRAFQGWEARLSELETRAAHLWPSIPGLAWSWSSRMVRSPGVAKRREDAEKGFVTACVAVGPRVSGRGSCLERVPDEHVQSESDHPLLSANHLGVPTPFSARPLARSSAPLPRSPVPLETRADHARCTTRPGGASARPRCALLKEASSRGCIRAARGRRGVYSIDREGEGEGGRVSVDGRDNIVQSRPPSTTTRPKRKRSRPPKEQGGKSERVPRRDNDLFKRKG